MSMTRTTRLTALAGTALVGIALTLSACGSLLGGGDDSASVGTENAEPAQTTTEETTAEESGPGLDGVYYTSDFYDTPIGQLTIKSDQLIYQQFSCNTNTPTIKDEIEATGVFAEGQPVIVWENEGSYKVGEGLIEGTQRYEVVSTGDYDIITLEGKRTFTNSITEEQALASYAEHYCN